jgi:hypothetical protein
MGHQFLTDRKFSWLVLVLVILVLLSAEDLLAKPNWVGVKYTGWSVQVQKGHKITDGNYLRLVLKFDIINKSKNGDIITSIYNRKIKWTGNSTIPILVYRQRSGYSVEESMVIEDIKFPNLHYSMEGNSPYKGEWYPGQVYKYVHSIPLSKLIKPAGNWKNTNEGWKRKKSKFALKSYTLDFQVQSHK